MTDITESWSRQREAMRKVMRPTAPLQTSQGWTTLAFLFFPIVVLMLVIVKGCR